MNKRKPKKIVIKKSRTVHTYSELWHASQCVLDAGLETPKGSIWQFLSSTVLTAFAFEAYLNHVGPKLFDCWAQLERVSPLAKFDLICEELEIKFEAGERPRTTLNELTNFRNTLAHGKTVLIEPPVKELNENADVDKYLGERPLTDWETKVRNSEFARRARDDVRLALEVIHAKIPSLEEGLFAFGITAAGATSG